MKNLNFLTLILAAVFLAGCVASKKEENAASTPVNGPTEQSGTDVLYQYAWHLENTGQGSFAGATGISGQDMNIKEVIDLGFTGMGIKIAVSDSGVDLTHPDLNDNQLVGQHRNYSQTSSATWKGTSVSPAPAGLEGHGTAVTGLIAAEGWNTIGSRGVSPNAKYAGFYFLGTFAEVSGSYEAKTYDQLWGNFDIFNYSYGYPGCTFVTSTQTILDRYKEGALNLRGGKGAVYVKAAGNDYVARNNDCYTSEPDDSYYLGNSNTNEDQNIPYLILAAAVNAKGVISSYSTPGSGVWVSSTGGEFGYSTSTYAIEKSPAMISTDIVGCDNGLSERTDDHSNFNKGSSTLNANCDYTSIMNGTSAATPTLSGVVALMLQANPLLSWRDVKHILATTAQRIKYSTAPLTHPFGDGLMSHTYDVLYTVNNANVSFSNTYGFGRVDAYAAVQMAQSYTSTLGVYAETLNPNNDGWYYNSGAVNMPIPDENSTGVESSINVLHNYNIESVQIRLTTNHTRIGELGVELTSPAGVKSRLLLVNSNILDNSLDDYLMITNAFYNETSKGTWKLKLIDGKADNEGSNYQGNLTKWSIKINGHKVSTSDSTSPSPVVAFVGNGNDASTTTSPVITITNSPSSDLMRYEVSVGTTSSLEDVKKWYSIGTATSVTISSMTLTAGVTYYAKVRAVDMSENVSTSVIKSWIAGQP